MCWGLQKRLKRLTRSSICAQNTMRTKGGGEGVTREGSTGHKNKKARQKSCDDRRVEPLQSSRLCYSVYILYMCAPCCVVIASSLLKSFVLPATKYIIDVAGLPPSLPSSRLPLPFQPLPEPLPLLLPFALCNPSSPSPCLLPPLLPLLPLPYLKMYVELS